MNLIELYGMDEEERQKKLDFLDLAPLDQANVRQLQAVFTDYGRKFADRFYEHLLAHPQTAIHLQDSTQLEALKEIQAKYFAELLEGVYDAAYFEGRLRVGVAHQRNGLEPVWYLGAYNQYIQLTFPLFAKAFGNNLDKVLPLLLSLIKVIFLDIGLALRTYFHKATEELRRNNEELQKALGLYWQAQRREEQLRKIISHEVRGGLGAIITSLEDLQDSVGPVLEASAIDQLQLASRRCWSLSNLLGEMLVSAKQTEGPSWVETRPIFETLAARFGLYAEGRAIHLHLPENPPRVWADAMQLREVFANLVANAVRYMDKEPGRVEISCKPEGNFYVFCVADDGPGIAPKLRERIFEPFVRGPAAGKHPEGTGLGLSFVKTAIEQNGGHVWVESTPGEGSRFWFTVPREQPKP